MKFFIRCVAFLCAACCAMVAAINVWPAYRHIRTADRNGDGRADIWRSYDGHGQLTEVDFDSNFDGTPDIEEYYQRGVLVRRERDRNFNGQTDLIEEFDPNTHGQIRSVIDTDYDGAADLLVLFRDGQPAFTERAPSLKHLQSPPWDAPAVHHAGAGRLDSLTDPFEAETAIRATTIESPDDGCVGLSTSGGLPRTRITVLGGLAPSTRLVADGVHSQPLTPALSLPSRAPPLS